MSGATFTPSPDQLAVIDHEPAHNGRVLAGPGTGKSSTGVALIRRLAETHPDLQIRMITFTRAATAELAKKVGTAELDIPPPSTIHSFALSLLLRNPRTTNLPEPLRIPDEYEVKTLIRPDIARRLRNRGFKKINVYKYLLNKTG
jgi:superfamily I DNA/RNA helicase